MTTEIPQTMQALVLGEYREDVTEAINGLQVADKPMPVPRRGQVLVRMAAAPCNPSDLLLLQGKYGALKVLPTVPGWEGAGTVVASGGGWLANRLVGRRVACALVGNRDGTWAEYFVARASECIPLKASVPDEQGASLIVNPLTALGLLETAGREGHAAAIHTAGASQVGRMLLAIAAKTGFPLIHIVRRDTQVELLNALGAQHILNMSDEDFGVQLKAICQQLNATVAFEAIAGKMTGTVLNAMPEGSTCYLYGALSEKGCGGIDPVELIFRKKTLRGFYLGDWLQQRGVLGVLRDSGRVQRMIRAGELETKIQRRLSLSDAVDGLKQYVGNMTGGKVLIVPHG